MESRAHVIKVTFSLLPLLSSPFKGDHVQIGVMKIAILLSCALRSPVTFSPDALISVGDSGSQKVQHQSEDRLASHLGSISTSNVITKNSPDLCMGRRPNAESEEFFVITLMVQQPR